MNAIAAIFKGFGFALVSIGTLPFFADPDVERPVIILILAKTDRGCFLPADFFCFLKQPIFLIGCREPVDFLYSQKLHLALILVIKLQIVGFQRFQLEYETGIFNGNLIAFFLT